MIRACFDRKFWRAILVGAIAATGTVRADALPMLSADHAHFVDPAGQAITLRGCNLGNWLILESWMFGGTVTVDGQNFKDQKTLETKFVERFGADRAAALMDTFRSSYITARDFELIKSFGFNVVRLPFDYRLLEDPTKPGTLKSGAFKWLDQAVALAEAAQVYVILDMHGVPGGQSVNDHTGESGRNKLWTDPAAQQRTIDLWRQIADHYKSNGTVAAYDLINEPYSDMRSDVRAELANLLPRIADAIRSTGDKHILFYPGALGGGIRFYGNPTSKGNIAFTEHYYPGLFGSKPALETHARLLGQELPAKRAYLDRLGTPYLVGEVNVVLQSEDPNRLMRAYYDHFAEFGWASTMWSYKLLKNDAGAQPSAWYMVTNADPLTKLDASADSYEAFEQFFQSLKTAPIAVNESLRTALTVREPTPLHLAKYAMLPDAAPTTPSANPPGYTSVDIGDVVAGHSSVTSDGSVQVMAGGSDINGTADAFRFVSREAKGEADERATITSFVDSAEYAKAGLMARWGDSPAAPMAMVNAFPDGTIALMTRSTQGGKTTETKVNADAELPLQLRLQVKASQAIASYRSTRGDSRAVGQASVPADGAFRIGLAVCSHHESGLTTVVAQLGEKSDAALPASTPTTIDFSKSLLANGSFEDAGDQEELAAHWSRWGDWMNRETGWSPTRDGRCVIGYHHWQIDGQGSSSGLWQDVKVEPGKRYTFAISALHDAIKDGKHDADTLELRLEAITPDGPVTLNTRNVSIAQLATGETWSRPAISGTATTDTLRVLAILNSSTEGNRGGAVKLDAATLTPVTDGK
ncbi:MAG: cellulase family glycosylhydrolase [Tepidisphaeraceae bacterium]